MDRGGVAAGTEGSAAFADPGTSAHLLVPTLGELSHSAQSQWDDLQLWMFVSIVVM